MKSLYNLLAFAVFVYPINTFIGNIDHVYSPADMIGISRSFISNQVDNGLNYSNALPISTAFSCYNRINFDMMPDCGIPESRVTISRAIIFVRKYFNFIFGKSSVPITSHPKFWNILFDTGQNYFNEIGIKNFFTIGVNVFLFQIAQFSNEFFFDNFVKIEYLLRYVASCIIGAIYDSRNVVSYFGVTDSPCGSIKKLRTFYLNNFAFAANDGICFSNSDSTVGSHDNTISIFESNDRSLSDTLILDQESSKQEEYKPKWLRWGIYGFSAAWFDTTTGHIVHSLEQKDIDVSHNGKQWFHLFGERCKYNLPAFCESNAELTGKP